MGTSSRYPGPTGGGWRDARRGLTRLKRGLDAIADAAPDALDNDSAEDPAHQLVRTARERIGGHLLSALRAELADDPEAFGLRAGLSEQSGPLIDTLDALQTTGLATLTAADAASPEEREVAFLRDITDRLSQPTGTVPEAQLRATATRCAERLLADQDLRAAVRGGTGGYRISGELFCGIFTFFFTDAVASVLKSVVAEHIKLAIPLLYLDPTGQVADWIADKLVGIIPNPCEEQAKDVQRAVSLAATARKLVGTTIGRLLDTDVEEEAP